MAPRNRGQRAAAGTAAGGQTPSRFLPRLLSVLSAWLAGPVLVVGAVTLNSALADQHATQPAPVPHASAPHFVTPRPSASHPAPQPPHQLPQHSFGNPQSSPASPQPYRVYPAGASAGSRSLAPSYGNPGRLAGERAFGGQPQRPFTPPNTPYRATPGGRMPGGPPGNPQGNNGEHLGGWMRQHQSQSPADRERALRQEQGFNRLAPQQQQNLVNRLHQLDQMPPAQQQRTMQRIENMERLSPERRQAVRSSAQQLGALPQERRRVVQRAFRDLREMPPEQRGAVMNSPQFAGQFSAQERSIMGNLLTVEPYQQNAPYSAR